MDWWISRFIVVTLIVVHRFTYLFGADSGDDTVAWNDVMAKPQIAGSDHSRLTALGRARDNPGAQPSTFPLQKSTWTFTFCALLTVLPCGRGKLYYCGLSRTRSLLPFTILLCLLCVDGFPSPSQCLTPAQCLRHPTTWLRTGLRRNLGLRTGGRRTGG